MLRQPILVGLAGLLSLPALSVPTAKPTHAARIPTTNVFLITIDTVRADHLGCYGGQSARTPAIDQLARDGVVFENAAAQVPLTWPSHAAILTGTYPFQNGVQDFTSPPLDAKFQTIAQALKRHGYVTGAVVSSFVLDRSFGLGRGFDFYDDAFPASAFKQAEISLVERDAGQSVDHALGWLKSQHTAGGRPFFLWLHLYDAHSPYRSPEPFASEYRDRPYDGAISYIDSQLARVFDWLRSTGVYDRTMIVLASDHGESLGEHGEREHGYFLYSATTRVPLIVKMAGKMHAQERIERAVETTAIPNTILRALALQDPAQQQFQAEDLLLGRDDSAAYSETFYPFSSFGWSPLHALRSERYHYIDAPQPELYDTKADPGETQNIISKQPAMASVLKQALAQREASKSPVESKQGGPQLSPEAVAKLRSLGYMAYRLPVSEEQIKAGLPDPKQKIDEFNTILRATDLFHSGKYADGAALLATVQQSDPKLYLIPFMLGEAALQQRDWKTARQQLESALKLNPTFDQAITALSRAYFELGDVAGARDSLRKALQQNPNNFRAWFELGEIEAKSDPASAEDAFVRAVKIQPNFGPAQLDLGMALYTGHRYAEAIAHLESAAKSDAENAISWNALGICYSQTGKLKKAVSSYQRALKLDPNLPQAHLNLGLVYQRLGMAEAKAEYDSACRLDQKLCGYATRH